MATNNPNVPAEQETAAKASAPDAKVMPSQPAQLNQTAPAATTVAAPVAATPVTAAPVVPAGTTMNPVPVDGVMRANEVKVDRDEEQRIAKDLAAKNKGADYFEQVANNDEVFKDVFREQARLERQREDEASKGDPTRDPVAKQAAMDMNTPAPGALEEAKEIRDGGKK